MEAHMTRFAPLTTLVAAFVLIVSITPSWGQPVCVAPACNATTSDDNGNTAGGTGALAAISPTTAGNTAFGLDALGSDTLGTDNIGIGLFALASNDTGNRNTAIGRGALLSNTTGSHNTATGEAALFANHVGSNNTAIGVHALVSSTGTKNIGIGYRAGATLTNGSNNIYIGSVSGTSSESQTIRIGKAQTQTFIAGINAASVSDAQVMIDTTTGQLGIATSSARYKRDIEAVGVRSEKVVALRPVTFAYKDDAQGATHYGLIAEEVAAVYPELVTRTATGDVQTVKYQELIPMLLNELQRQQQTLDRQQQELAEVTVQTGYIGNRLDREHG